MSQKDEDEMVMVEVAPGEAALLFTLDGLQAFLPADIGMIEQDDLPWHIRVAERAMLLIRDYALQQQMMHQAGLVVEDDSSSDDLATEILMAIAEQQTPGEA